MGPGETQPEKSCIYAIKPVFYQGPAIPGELSSTCETPVVVALGKKAEQGGSSLFCIKAPPPPISWALRGGDARAWPITRRLGAEAGRAEPGLGPCAAEGTFRTGSSLLDLSLSSQQLRIQGRNSHLHCAGEAAEAQRGHVTCSRSHNGSAPEPEPTQAQTPGPGSVVLLLCLPSYCPGPGPQLGTPTLGPVLSSHRPPLPNGPHPRA